MKLAIVLLAAVCCLSCSTSIHGPGLGAEANSAARVEPRMQDLISSLDAATHDEKPSLRFVRYDVQGRVIHVALGGLWATDENIALVSAIASLESLEVNCRLGRQPLTPSSLAPLIAAEQLKELSLNYAAPTIGKELLCAVSKLNNLTRLRISGSDIAPAGLAQLARLRKLQKLEFVKCHKLSDEHFLQLKYLRRLGDLDLRYSPISDKSLRVAADLTSLCRLGVEGTGVSEAVIRWFRSNSKIEICGDPEAHQK